MGVPMRTRRLGVRLWSSVAAEVGGKKDALGMTMGDLAGVLQGAGFEKYRSRQVYEFVHFAKGQSWRNALHLPLRLRSWLEENYQIDHGYILNRQQSADGTRKYLVQVGTGRSVETVLIPEETRATLCVSSQVGCALSCSFCHTGTQQFAGNLSSGQILKQLLALPTGVQRMVTNFVFMGQGEPLYNFKAVAKAIAIMTDPGGLAVGHGKITVSTAGIVPLIPKVASELGVNLAVSLHAPNDALRSTIMAINKTYPLAALIEACGRFIDAASCATRRVSFEYVMLEGVNDQIAHAVELHRLVRHLPCHINLLPFNPWPGAAYRTSRPEQIARFKGELISRGLPATVRRTRGEDILAACGQLKSPLLDPCTA